MKKYPELKIIGIYSLLFVLTIVTIQQIWFRELFDKMNFLNWDAEHYNSIKENGYEGFRVAFFPLFPLIWRFLSVNVYGIVFINSIVFLFSFYILIRNLEIISVKEIILYLSIPSFIFFYLPYTESIFFLCSVLLLLGIKTKKDILVYLGLFFAILSRPAFTIFVPSLLITELLSQDKHKLFVRLSLYFLITFIGIVLVGIIQYNDTGEWFKFFSAQKGWGTELQIPKLPLTSWAGGLIVRLDGFAFLIGVLAGGFLTALILKLNYFFKRVVPKEVVFSLSYLGGITLSLLIFRGGSLASLNRYVFAVPFIIVVLNYWFAQEYNMKTKQLLYIFGLIFLFWFLFGSYVHIQQIVKFLLLSFYMLLLFGVKSERSIVRNVASILLIMINITFQVIFYLRFLNGGWVG